MHKEVFRKTNEFRFINKWVGIDIYYQYFWSQQYWEQFLLYSVIVLMSWNLYFKVENHKSWLIPDTFKYWSFSISPSNEYSEWISFRIDWFDLLAVQETLKSLLQHHSLKASSLWCSAFLMVQLAHLYMTTGKTIVLTIRTFVTKVPSLLFNTLSRFVIVFLPKNKCLLISWLQLPSIVILEPKKIKSVTVYTFPPSICHEVMRLDAMILIFWMLSFKPAFSLSSLTLIKKHFSSSSPSAIRVVSFTYLRLLIFLLAILIPTCDSSSPTFHMMYSAYKLNKQGDNIQSWCTPFPI